MCFKESHRKDLWPAILIVGSWLSVAALTAVAADGPATGSFPQIVPPKAPSSASWLDKMFVPPPDPTASQAAPSKAPASSTSASSTPVATPPAPNAPVAAPAATASPLAVPSAPKSTPIARDPTGMNPELRKLLEAVVETARTTNNSGAPAAVPVYQVPAITLKALVVGREGKPSALLAIGEKGTNMMVREGHDYPLNAHGTQFTLTVTTIEAGQVELEIKPGNQKLVLH